MTGTSATPLLRTKLAPPPARDGLLARERLLDHLAEPGRARLTLVSAPAGWGKTTLLREWAGTVAPSRAWVSLDAADNDPVRFWAYVVEALRGAGAPVRTVPSVAAAGHDGLAALVDELHALPDPMALALDDLHVITEERVLDGLAFLVDHAPEPVRVGVATRTDPPLGLARMRVRGELAEARADHLRFSDDEAAALLRAATGSHLDAAAVRRLCARTEGWAAGLYLAALSLRGRDGAGDAFVDAFAGDDRLVVDYLAEEVLAAQPEDRRRFLLDTSILSRLSAPLCDAVTGRHDGAGILADLEASNLFLVPLDNRRRWYRFHHLFGELLRHQLTADDPDRVAVLHRRAGAWLAANGAQDEAIGHLAAGGDVDAAAELVARNWSVYHDRGWIPSVRRWISLLPDELVRADARLCLANAWIAITSGEQSLVAPWVDAAERALGDREPPPRMAERIALARSLDHLLDGRTALALAAGRRALDMGGLPRDSQWHAVACMAVGMAQFHERRDDLGERMLREAADVGERTGMSVAALLSLGHLAELALDRGDVPAAEALALRSLDFNPEDHARFPHAACSFAAVAQVRARQGLLDEAGRHADRALELARRGDAASEIVHAQLVRAEVRLTAGERRGARADLEDARGLTAGGGVPPRLAQRFLEMDERLRRPEAAPVQAGGDLTERERVVLGLLAGPASLREIAGELTVSPNTVKTQVRAIYRKLGVDRRSRAVHAARERGILPG